VAPTPYTPSGQLDIIIVVSGLTHRVQLPVDVVESGGSWYVVNHQPAMSNEPGDVVGQLWWDIVRQQYHTGVAAPSWELQQRVGTAFIPVDGGSLASAGSNAGAPALGWQATLTFRDAEQHLARVQLAETSNGTLNKSQYSALGADVQQLIDAYITSTGGDDVRDFVMTRADLPTTRFLWYTNTPNREIRRARGLA